MLGLFGELEVAGQGGKAMKNVFWVTARQGVDMMPMADIAFGTEDFDGLGEWMDTMRERLGANWCSFTIAIQKVKEAEDYAEEE